MTRIINPFYSTSQVPSVTRNSVAQPVYARLPVVPRNGSPVPHLTSLYHFSDAGEYGDRSYPGNCGGNLIKDLLRFFGPNSVLDPMTGSGTCGQVCRDLKIDCWSSDMREGVDACDPASLPSRTFDFIWIHPPYWRQKLYTDDVRDLSRTPTLEAFLQRYRLLIANCAEHLASNSTLAILMGDYRDRELGFVPLTFHTKQIAFDLGLKPAATDIIRFCHGASAGRKVYGGSFIPALHDVCMLFERGA